MGVLSWLFGPDVKKLKEAKDIGGLEAALKTASKADTRSGAAHALGDLGAKEATAALTEALNDRSGPVRDAAAEALGKVGDAQCVGPLAALLQDTDLEVQLSAIRSLGRVGDEATANYLIPLLSAQEVRVVLVARKALRRWTTVSEVASALGDVATRLRERRRAQAIEWWKRTASADKRCDVCAQGVAAGAGFLLDSEEMIDSDSYLDQATRLRMSTERAIGRTVVPGLDRSLTDMMFEPLIRFSVIQNVRQTETPWLVCESCIDTLFK